MFTFRIEGAYDATKLLVGGWPTKAVTVIQRGADWQSRGDFHLVVPMSDVSDPTMSPDAPTVAHLKTILDHTADLTDDDRLMVNCWVGQSRSAATTLAILMQHGLNAEDAFEAMLKQRPIAIPNVLICKHIDTFFGLPGTMEGLATEHLRRELANIIAPKDQAVSVKEIDDMKNWMKLL